MKRVNKMNKGVFLFLLLGLFMFSGYKTPTTQKFTHKLNRCKNTVSMFFIPITRVKNPVTLAIIHRKIKGIKNVPPGLFILSGRNLKMKMLIGFILKVIRARNGQYIFSISHTLLNGKFISLDVKDFFVIVVFSKRNNNKALLYFRIEGNKKSKYFPLLVRYFGKEFQRSKYILRGIFSLAKYKCHK